MRLLFVEDDTAIREFVTQGLREEGYAVDVFSRGDDALLLAESVDFDVAILDIALPGMDGLELCRRLRGRTEGGPAILFLTARDAILDRVEGLDAGADDYLVKPFAFIELLARIRTLLRRGGGTAPVLAVGNVVLDPATRTVTRSGEDVRLANKEFLVLEYLMRNAGRVVTKNMIAEHVWDLDLDAESNFIEVYIHLIRKKIDRAGQPSLIETLRGVGYRVNADG